MAIVSFATRFWLFGDVSGVCSELLRIGVIGDAMRVASERFQT